MKYLLLLLALLAPVAHSQQVVRSVDSTNELKTIPVLSRNPVRYVMNLGFFVPVETAAPENGTNTFRSTVNTNYLWVIGAGTGNIASAGTNALADGNYGDATVSSAGTIITVNSGAVTGAKIAPATIGTNHLDAPFHAKLVTIPTIATNNLDATAYGLLMASGSAAWGDLTGVPAGFADGVDDVGTASVSGSVSAATRGALASLTGTAGAVCLVTADGSLWKWAASATTNAGQIYGGSAGHYWLLQPVNGWVPGTAYGLVGNGSTDNAVVLASIAALAGASNYAVYAAPGTYNVGSQVNWVNASNVVLRGAGWNRTVFYWTSTGASDEAMRWTGTGGRIRIENLALKGNPAGSHRMLNQNGFYQDVQFNEVEITAPDKLVVLWEATSRVNDFGFDRCWLHGTTVNGSSALTFGFAALPSTNVWVRRSVIESIGGSPIELYDVDAFELSDSTITHYGFADTVQPHAVYGAANLTNNLTHVRLLRNRFGSNMDPDKHMGVSYVQFYDHSSTNLGIHNVWVQDNVFGYNSGTNKADGLYLYGIENAVVSGNVFTNLHSVGIAFGNSTRNVTVDNNDLYGNGTAEYGITIGASSATGKVSSGHRITNNRIQGFLRDHLGFGGVGGVYAGNTVLLTCGALEADYSAIQLAPFTGHAVDLIIQNNVVHDLTSSPTYSWGGIRMGKAARTLTNMVTVYTNSASTTSGHLVAGNVLNDVAGAPVTAGSGNKVYTNTRLGTPGLNSLTGATIRDND